jgi:hypothetical protein
MSSEATGGPPLVGSSATPPDPTGGPSDSQSNAGSLPAVQTGDSGGSSGSCLRPRRHRIHPLWPIAAAVVMVAAALAVTPIASSHASPSGNAVSTPPVGPTPAVSGITVTNSTVTELNLLNGSTLNASGQLYRGYQGTTNKAFPEIIAGSSLAEGVWKNFSHVLELAPPALCSCSNWHTAGVTLFSAQPGTSATLFSNITMAYYPTEGGIADGVEAYLFVSPVLRSNGTFAYLATGDAGNNSPATREGAVIFPYSSSPYIVVQWDPEYGTNGTKAAGEYNLYLVRPGTGGVVSASDITTKSDLGNGTGYYPRSGDVLAFAATYSVPTKTLTVHLFDQNNPTLLTNLSTNLSKTYSFAPAYSQTGTYDLGLGGSGNNAAGWGALSISAITAPVPSGEEGVAVSSNPGTCGALYGAVGGSTSLAANETSLLIASGGTISFKSAPMCEKYAWNTTAGAATGTPYTFVKWLLFGGVKFVSGYSATSSPVEVKVSALGGIEGVYKPATTDTPYDAGWVGYYGNRTIYPTEDTTPFAIQPETTGNDTQTTKNGAYSDGGYSLVNNSATLSGLPVFKYNASAGQFQLYMTSTVDSEVWTPCWYATYGYSIETGSHNDPFDPGVNNIACYPIALMDAVEHVSGVPSSAVTDITGIYGTNVSAQNINSSTWDGYLPKGLNGSSVDIGPWVADAIDAYNVADDAAGAAEPPEPLLAPDAPWVENMQMGQGFWDGEHLKYDILEAVDGVGNPLSLAGNFVHDMVPFISGKLINTVSTFVVDMIFTLALCETVVGCAFGVALDIVSALLNYFGWSLPGSDNGPWNGVQLDSVSKVQGNGTVRDWTVTNNTAVNASNNSCWWNSPCDHSLYACWNYPSYCGNNTFEEGMIAETSIPSGALSKVSAGAVNLSGANEMWRYDVCNNGGTCNGGYDNSYGNCTTYIPCAYQGATTSTLSYPLEPAVSIGGTFIDGGKVAPNATVTLAQTYGGKLTDFTTLTNYSGYWHFFARPGATYTYTVTPAGGTPSGSITIPAWETAVTATGENVSLGTLTYGSSGDETGFQETGVPQGLGWTVWLNSTGTGGPHYAISSTANVISPLAASGSYTWVAGYGGVTATYLHSSGAITVPTSSAIALRFPTYNAIFSQRAPTAGAYPSSLPWTLYLNSSTYGSTFSISSSNQTISLPLPNGTYSYAAAANVPANRAAGGLFRMSGSTVYEGIGFLSDKLLAGYAATPAGSGWSHTFTFTVPSGTSHVLLFWTFNDDVTANVSLPPGLTIEKEFGNSTGVAFGALAAGNYSASFSGGSGWVNTVTMAAYGISNDSDYSYQFADVSQSMNLTMTSGASVYLGALINGGGFPITNWSLTTVNEETYPQNQQGTSNETDLIGQQSSNTFSFQTKAYGYGIVGAAIVPAWVQLLAGYAATPAESEWSHTFTFTVPSGTSHVLLFWTFNDDVTANVSLPPGLTIEKEFGNSTGVAFGALAAGNYSASFSGGSGWVNTVTMAAYGISNDSDYNYQFAMNATHGKNLTMNAGATVYLGALTNGGGFPITAWSLTTVNEETYPEYQQGTTNETDLIGQQTSDRFTFQTNAIGYGIVAAGIYYVG